MHALPEKCALQAAAVALAVLLVSACGGAPGKDRKADGKLMPDFALSDVNPSSTSFGTTVSPRQFLTRVTAWYFGHST